MDVDREQGAAAAGSAEADVDAEAGGMPAEAPPVDTKPPGTEIVLHEDKRYYPSAEEVSTLTHISLLFCVGWRGVIAT